VSTRIAVTFRAAACSVAIRPTVIRSALILVGASVGLAGCGQKGPLYLSGRPRNAPWPAPVAPPAAGPAAAAASAAAAPRDEPALPAIPTDLPGTSDEKQ
jgi:predicted small lipoprotein YifL